MKRRIISLMLASVLLIGSLTGCGGKETETSKQEGQTQQDQDSQMETETETEEQMSPEEKWYNSAESNGVNFSLTQSCLDAYLNYVVSENATEDYANFFKKTDYYEYDKEEPSKPVFFTIAGMDKSEPYLLMSTVDTSQSDRIMFKTCSNGKIFAFEEFRPDRYSSKDTYNHYTATLYVVSEQPENANAKFCEMVTDRYVDRYGEQSLNYSRYDWIYDVNGEVWNSELKESVSTEGYEESLVKHNTIAELKWFSIEQIEQARSYYSQFVRAEDDYGFEINPAIKAVSKDVTVSGNSASLYYDICKNPFICLVSDRMDASALPKENQLPSDYIENEIMKEMKELDYDDANGEWWSTNILDFFKGKLGEDLVMKENKTGYVVISNTSPYKWNGYDCFFEVEIFYDGEGITTRHPETGSKYEKSLKSYSFKMIVATHSQEELDAASVVVKDYAQNMQLPSVEVKEEPTAIGGLRYVYTTEQTKALFTYIARNAWSDWEDGVVRSRNYVIEHDVPISGYAVNLYEEIPVNNYYEKCIYIHSSSTQTVSDEYIRN